jgi:hypothetical protein
MTGTGFVVGFLSRETNIKIYVLKTATVNQNLHIDVRTTFVKQLHHTISRGMFFLNGHPILF